MEIQFNLCAVDGKFIDRKIIGNNLYHLNEYGLSSGLYIYQVKASKGILSGKVVIE